MINYRIWKSDTDDAILVEVFNNDCKEVASVEKEIINQGYVIARTEFDMFGCAWILAAKLGD